MGGIRRHFVGVAAKEGSDIGEKSTERVLGMRDLQRTRNRRWHVVSHLPQVWDANDKTARKDQAEDTHTTLQTSLSL